MIGVIHTNYTLLKKHKCKWCNNVNGFPPKYRIGDVVYIADIYNGDYYANKQPLTIERVIITISAHSMKIVYELKCKEYEDRVLEYMCFSTYEECKEWCDKHNSRKEI